MDDIIYIGSSQTLVDEFKCEMMKAFKMTDLGLLHYFLGLEIKQGIHGVFIAQRKYAEDLVKRISMQGCKKAMTPMNTSEKLEANDGSGHADAKKYRSIVGGLIYLAHTLPDIMFSVGVLSKFMNSPSKHHLGAA